MLIQTIAGIFERELQTLKAEIMLYADETSLWHVEEGINNSAGNLCLHLVGNLNHFIGAILGNTGYERDRDLEFSAHNYSRLELIAALENTKTVVKNTFQHLSDADLKKNYPVEKHGEIVKTDFMLLHLLTHFNYHLGQINYHRRLLG